MFNENIKDRKNEYYKMLEGNIREYEQKRLTIEAETATRDEPECVKDPCDLVFTTEVDVPARA